MDSFTTHLRHGNNHMRLNGKVFDPEGHATDLFSSWAKHYLRGRAKKRSVPFFLYLAYKAPHFPIEPPKEWIDKIRSLAPHLDEKRAANAAFIEHLDNGISQVLKLLKETSFEQDTMVVF